MTRLERSLIDAAARLVPLSYRQTFVGDLLEQYERRRRSAGPTAARIALVAEIIHSAPSLTRWRLTRGVVMNTHARSQDPFHMGRLTPGATAGRALGLFKSFYLRALAVFLLVHFPLRMVGHFVRSDEAIAAALQSVALQALLANGLLLISWTLVEGTLLATLVQRRRGHEIGIPAALKESLRRFPTFLAARTLFLLAVAAGSVVLIVPGILATCLLMLHGWLIFDRGLGALAALKESARIVKSRLRKTLGLSLPVAGMTLVWVALGVLFVAQTLRFTAPLMPIFKIAPFTMTLMETGFVLFTILTGILYANYSPNGSSLEESPV